MIELLNASIRGFEPATANEDPSKRKRKLKEEILKSNSISDQARKLCRESAKLSIHVRFYLYRNSGVRGRSEKDLDNLLKIFCDVLPDNIDNAIPPTDKGLGLIASDSAIFEIRCSKELVDNEQDEGIDYEIFDAS